MKTIDGTRQRGVSLIVVLLLLLVMTLLGLAVLRSTVLGERMASNLVDR
ncbi:pilus assembly protein, partial [Xanthomonas citri pv. citri]|nr:pilus assembly protein [Xanthomonas citri pv. citri]